MARALSIFDPFASLDAIRNEFLEGSPLLSSIGIATPTTDIYTTDDGTMVVEAHLPNFNEEDVSVSVDDGTLTIRASRHEQAEDAKRKYIVRESSTTFTRSVMLPQGADPDAISASFDAGMLTVTVPMPKRTTPKQITISPVKGVAGSET
ncbi:Hsp20/alpha crystallin family protein [Curtobacterium ammoniigenes]|uniref:Hsp20/alpha crystallin family protein n=1 Tax=Curtobacterium ammoniigenes TaxID=395387 RepID=UPI00082D17A9|nr:Hsp20/alpha crystallin family protein [Curtobacterium ammoniigenes]